MADKTEQSAAESVHRTERVLVTMIASIVALSILAFVARIVGAVVGVDDYTAGAWPVVTVLPLIGLPVAILLIIAFVVVTVVRRGRESRGTTR
ncbi:hypothetical protein EDF38_2080 [Frigoribacterium sp. PhB160]|uniref:hypothetical protein n=1 Tax=Frigoribacterium sp. PhB160 TaxID=2485192 RepID=UPI000F479DED|nr:hypothetical protein [Frigoribacterium sp. PhB160]ROS59236.1 hypothetical protein EDF38_2080 [Frigoribacterium sp. PhB160]